MIEEEESAIRSRNPNHHDGDHSLDHYFDHQLNSNYHGSGSNYKREEKKPALRAAELTSVRGGGAAATAERRRKRLVQSPAFVTTDKKGDIWSPRDGRSHETRRSSSRGHHGREFEEDEFDLDEEGYDEDVQEDMFDEGEYEQQQHHLGLLRVPCSIAVNSGEATQYASSQGTSLTSSHGTSLKICSSVELFGLGFE